MTNAAQHRQNILLAAVRLFREKGYASTGLNEILASSGSPKGSLYYYFPRGKEQLGVEAVLLSGQVVEETLRKLAASSSSSREFIAGYCDLLCGWMRDSKFKSGCPITTTVVETVPDSAAITDASRGVFERWRRIIAEVFQRDGGTSESAEQRADFALSAIEGALVLARVRCCEAPIRSLPILLCPHE